MDARETRGYVVWLIAAVVVALPEVWALADRDVPWPTISGTIGHLEYLWSGTAVVVAAVLVVAALQTIRYPPLRVMAARPRRRQLSPWTYFPAAAIVVVGSSLATAAFDDDEWHLAYVLYGLLALFWIVIPSLAAHFFAYDVPFPTLFQTIVNLERRLPAVALLVAAVLVVLLLHLAFYPWPDISHVLQQKPPTTSSP